MTAYIYITASLLIYPIIAQVTVQLSNRFPKTQKKIVWTLCVINMLTIFALSNHIITISQNLNWFFITLIYFTISLLLCLKQYNKSPTNKNMGSVLQTIVFGIGYLIATFGFFFIFIISSDLDSDQRKWLTDKLIYIERNIGQGPDPSERLKKIEVYKAIKQFPILAYRIQEKTYDEWNLPLQEKLDVSFSNIEQKLILTSIVKGSKVFTFSDTINLTEKQSR
jgi:hypothetical protein